MTQWRQQPQDICAGNQTSEEQIRQMGQMETCSSENTPTKFLTENSARQPLGQCPGVSVGDPTQTFAGRLLACLREEHTNMRFVRDLLDEFLGMYYP